MSYTKELIIFKIVWSIDSSLKKSKAMDEIFQQIHVINNNKKMYIPDELVFVIKTFVFYDLNNQQSSSKYFEKISKTIKCENEPMKNLCLDYF